MGKTHTFSSSWLIAVSLKVGRVCRINQMHLSLEPLNWMYFTRDEKSMEICLFMHEVISAVLASNGQKGRKETGDQRNVCVRINDILSRIMDVSSTTTSRYKVFHWFCLTFRHSASSIWDRSFAALQRTLFIYLINKYISLSDICLTVHHWYK